MATPILLSLLLLLALTSPALSKAVCHDNVFTPTPAQTKGPFWYRGMPIRRDITEDVRGVPLTLSIRTLRRNCRPFPPNTLVELWSTDARGSYSGFNGTNGRDMRFGTFLRGGQLTDRNGVVVFDTIVPSFYEQRIPHLHVRVEFATVRGGRREFSSQIYLSEREYEAAANVYGRGSGTDMDADVVILGNRSELATLTVQLTQQQPSGFVGFFTMALDA